MDAIETRLARIESQVRFQRRIIAFLIILLMAGISYGATAPIPEVIQARRFEVVNPEGRKVVVIQSWEFGGEIKTYPAKGKYWPSISLVHTDGGHGLLKVKNTAGKTIMSTGGFPSGDGYLVVHGKNGNSKLRAYANKFGGVLGVMNNSKKTIFLLNGDENGNGSMGISNHAGIRNFSFGASGSGGFLVLKNKSGEEVLTMIAGEKSGTVLVSSLAEKEKAIWISGKTGIAISNKTGKMVVQIYADEYGMGYVGAFNRQGKGRTLEPR